MARPVVVAGLAGHPGHLAMVLVLFMVAVLVVMQHNRGEAVAVQFVLSGPAVLVHTHQLA
jgi:hypothetical protein